MALRRPPTPVELKADDIVEYNEERQEIMLGPHINLFKSNESNQIISFLYS
jgi:hypothetical protein